MPEPRSSATTVERVTDADGHARRSPPCAARRSTSTADGHDPATATVPDEGDLRVELRPNVVQRDGHRCRRRADRRACASSSTASELHHRDGRGRRVCARRACPAEGPRLQDARLSAGRAPDRRRDDQGRRHAARSRPARSTRPSAIFEAPGRLDAMLDLIDRTEANAHGHRRQGDRRPPVLRHRPARAPPRSAPSARRRSSTSRSCCRCSRSAASTRSRGWWS